MRRLTLFWMFSSLLLVFTVAAAQDTPAAGEVRVDAWGLEQVYVPAGCFRMGTTAAQMEYAKTLDGPSWATSRSHLEMRDHEVCLTQGYWLDRYEVTNAAFEAFVAAGGYTTPAYWSEKGAAWLAQQAGHALPVSCSEPSADTAQQPRVCVTWYEAEAYAAWRGGALPTEAQWEFAARGADALIYPWGNTWDSARANVLDSASLTPVGRYPDGVSWVGAADLAGNAMEWVQDWLDRGYKPDAVTDPTGAKNGRVKVEKGGWWGSNAYVARSAYRHFEDPPTYQDHHIGFRIVSLADG